MFLAVVEGHLRICCNVYLCPVQYENVLCFKKTFKYIYSIVTTLIFLLPGVFVEIVGKYLQRLKIYAAGIYVPQVQYFS